MKSITHMNTFQMRFSLLFVSQMKETTGQGHSKDSFQISQLDTKPYIQPHQTWPTTQGRRTAAWQPGHIHGQWMTAQTPSLLLLPSSSGCHDTTAKHKSHLIDETFAVRKVTNHHCISEDVVVEPFMNNHIPRAIESCKLPAIPPILNTMTVSLKPVTKLSHRLRWNEQQHPRIY